MDVIALGNQKGGVGKTTTTYQLGGTLASMGRRVLLVDNDPQGSLTQGFWGPEGYDSIAASESVAAIYAADPPPLPSRVIRPTAFAGIDLLPGSGEATRYNVPLPWEASEHRQDCLRDFLAQVEGDYDFVLIDSPPNLHLCTWASLVAAGFLIVPVQTEDFGVQGLAAVNAWAGLVRSGPNPGLSLLGYLLTMVNNRLGIHKGYGEILRDGYGDQVFTSTIPAAVDLKESVAARMPISSYKPKGASTRAFRVFAEEIIARIESHRPATALREAI